MFRRALFPIARTAIGTFVLATSFAFAIAANAQDDDSKVDPEFRAAIKEYLEVQGAGPSTGQGVAFGIANDVLMSLAQSGTEMTDAVQSIVLEQAIETFGAKFSDVDFLAELYSPVYLEHFNEAEIREMTAFFRSPVGKKSLELVVPISEAGMAAIREAALEDTPGFQAALDAKLKEAGPVAP